MLSSRSASTSSTPSRCARSNVAALKISRRTCVRVAAGTLQPGDTVLVAGATGGVGQLVTAKLLERGYKVKAIARSTNSNRLQDYGPNCTVVGADLRQPGAVEPLLEGVAAVVCATGTTAFPSKRWEGNNGPKPTDWVATSNLINAAKKKKLARFVLLTSAGVERREVFPFALLNLFGVLRYKRESEMLLQDSKLPYTIIRPNRLTDGPYTSYDLNTLLQATAGSRQDVQLALTDRLMGETSRIATAEAVVQSLLVPETENKVYAITSTEGDGPGQDTKKWESLFATAQP